jgi:hypothetical protein
VEQTALLLALAALLVAAGLAGTVLPALPGIPLIFLGLFVAAWAEDFQHVGLWTIGILGALALVAYVVDLVAGALGAKKFGASRLAVVGALLGAVAGLFLGIAGILLGPFVGAAAGELVARRDLLQAGRAGFGTWLGLVVGGAVKIAIAFSMLAVFIAARLL